MASCEIWNQVDEACVHFDECLIDGAALRSGGKCFMCRSESKDQDLVALIGCLIFVLWLMLGAVSPEVDDVIRNML